MKPGIKTTEFWLSLIAVIAGAVALNYAESELGQIAGAVAAGLGTLGYGHSRAQVKKMEAASVTVNNTMGGVR